MNTIELNSTKFVLVPEEHWKAIIRAFSDCNIMPLVKSLGRKKLPRGQPELKLKEYLTTLNKDASFQRQHLTRIVGTKVSSGILNKLCDEKIIRRESRGWYKKL